MKTLRILLVVLTALLAANFALAQTWTPTSAASTNNWFAVASSANGKKLVAAVYGGGIWVSINSGSTWTMTSAPNTNYWSSVASSADGTRLAAADSADGVIYTSANSGTTWTKKNVPDWGWNSIASSADGTKLVAAAGSGYIYTSANSGTTWLSNRISATFAVWVASSADGTRLVAAAEEGNIFTSTDSGTTWQLTAASPNQFLFSAACSADGSKLVVGGGPPISSIFISTNAGVTWTANNVPGVGYENWQSIASSADGTRLVAVAGSTVVSSYGEGYIYTSTDLGATWTKADAPFKLWTGVASSADGGKLVGVAAPGRLMLPAGGIYTSPTTAVPTLNQTISGSNLRLSWLVPSMNFVLQQSSDLCTWTDMTYTPVLNLTNLQNEVILSPANSSGFYRLKTP